MIVEWNTRAGQDDTLPCPVTGMFQSIPAGKKTKPVKHSSLTLCCNNLK
jgi:hypothetical protein